MADMKVGMGMPGQDKECLTPEEEKKLDEHGELIVHGQPWSYVPTGLYLNVFGTKALRGASEGSTVNMGCDRHYAGQSLRMEDLTLVVCTTAGKPTFNVDGWGASLEIPADLARDALKKQYVTEWMIETTREVFGESESRLENGDQFAVWLAMTADSAIRATGL
jgi:hypothetical protein